MTYFLNFDTCFISGKRLKLETSNLYCIITTCSVECYWHCSDGTVHYKFDKTVNFRGFRCATTSPVTVFINFVFYIHNYNEL